MTARSSGSVVLEEETTSDSDSGTESGWKTVLFNCRCHTFDEVERQLIKATGCSLSRARAMSWEVHSKGSSVVYEGTAQRCEAAALILEDIGLIVQVSQ